MWEIFDASDGNYGVPRMPHELRHGGVVVDAKRVRSLMRVHGMAHTIPRLASVLDLGAGRLLGFSMADHMRTGLVLDAHRSSRSARRRSAPVAAFEQQPEQILGVAVAQVREQVIQTGIIMVGHRVFVFL
jgi:transposase InsO family protein